MSDDSKKQFELLLERLEKKLRDLEELESHIKKLFPKTVDARSAFVFEQRLKAAAELYRLQLAYLQEISRLTEKINALEDELPKQLQEELLSKVRQLLIKQGGEIYDS